MNLQLDSIWAEYRKSLKAFLHSKISEPADVDDLLQDILIKSYKHIGDLKKESSVKSWLFQIANRSIIDFYRKQGRISNVSEDDLWYGKDERSVQMELSHCIEPFIKALPSEQAELLTLVDLEGQSQKAYAEAKGMSYSTLKSRVQQSRKALRALFDDCCQYEQDASGNLLEYNPKTQSRDCKDC